MKILIYFLLGLSLLLVPVSVIADNGDIIQTETRPSVVKWKLDTFKCLIFTKTCIITYRKIDINGKKIDEIDIIFINRNDDPNTPEDETSTDFTDLVRAINNGSNIKTTIKNAVKAKLGL